MSNIAENELKTVGGVPLLGPESPDLDFMAWRDRMGSCINSLSSRFNVLVDPAPPIPDPIDIANYDHPAGMNAHQRRVHEGIVAAHSDFLFFCRQRKRGPQP